ncbi:MAG: hypothetical protein K2J73_11575 [Oscillospiraceae bacterium]|nr:hypothetical protein [Oscillospiraceae bacterium]
MKKIFLMIPILTLAVALVGCGNSDSVQNESQTASSPAATESIADDTALTETSAREGASSANTLNVCFGDGGEPFTLHLYENETAAAIARHVGTENWRLPIYHYDDYENWEVMQYYDIPARYEIPSNPETVTTEKAGEVYYSEPNRIVLFFGDAEVSNEYTKVGYFDYTEEFKEAVENNPVLEGWGNKIVFINSTD